MLPAVGYTNADQSHFTSRHYWEVGDTDARLQTGWLGRYLDRVGTADNPLQGVSLDGDLSPSLATAKKPVAALSGAGDYSFWAPGVYGQVEDRMLERRRIARLITRARQALAGARDVTYQSSRLRQQLAPFNRRIPTALFRTRSPTAGSRIRLAGLAAMLAAGLPLHCVALSAYGGYDTHSEQADTSGRRTSS